MVWHGWMVPCTKHGTNQRMGPGTFRWVSKFDAVFFRPGLSQIISPTISKEWVSWKRTAKSSDLVERILRTGTNYLSIYSNCLVNFKQICSPGTTGMSDGSGPSAHKRSVSKTPYEGPSQRTVPVNEALWCIIYHVYLQ